MNRKLLDSVFEVLLLGCAGDDVKAEMVLTDTMAEFVGGLTEEERLILGGQPLLRIFLKFSKAGGAKEPALVQVNTGGPWYKVVSGDKILLSDLLAISERLYFIGETAEREELYELI